MTRRSVIVLLAATASVVAPMAGYFGLQRRSPEAVHAGPSALPPTPNPRAIGVDVAAPPMAPPSVGTPSGSSTSAVEATLDEPALMARLRELRSSDPNLTLQLARQGNERFPDGADAAERAWFTVKALTELGRRDEASAEGRALLERYRGSRWADDVYRHLFVNPPTHPSERGYGKQFELDP
jgi:hypothetical protein